MATGASEAKAETKPESKPEANKEKEVEEKQEQLKYKTSVLRVSIHCEGCKRKVKKILTNIDGVYTTNIDLRQQKVIVAGDVASETLIRKLEKNGKHAELWPESKAEQKEKKQGKAKNKAKQQQQQQQKQGDQESSDEGNNNPAEKETVKEPSKSKENGNGGAGAGTSKNVENNGSVHHVIKVNEAGGQVAKESKPDQVKQTVTFAAGSQSPVGGGESDGGVEKSGGGGSSGGKKKKNKGQKGNNGNSNVVIGEGEPSGVGSDAPAGTGSPIYGPHGPTHAPFPSPANYSPPRQHGYSHPQYPPPPHYYTPPVYAVSYNTAHARPSYSTSYYTAQTPHSYAYMHPGTGSEIPPSDVDSYSSQPADSFEIFSDENPNACSIM